MDVRKYEIRSCCLIQIKSIKALLQTYRDKQIVPYKIQTNYAAAPRDETIFDSLNLYVEIKDESVIVLTGVIKYWTPNEWSDKSCVLCTFQSLDSCITWFRNESEAANICAEILDRNC